MKLALMGLLAMALIFGAYQAVEIIWGEPPTDRVLAIDGSHSFRSEVETCPEQLEPFVEAAVNDLSRLYVTSFANDALGRPWAYEEDFEAAYDKAHENDEVEQRTRGKWSDKHVTRVRATLHDIAEQAIQFDSVVLEQLERIGLALGDRGDRRLEVTFCSDGQIIDELVNVRRRFDQERAIHLWRPRLAGLDGATVRIHGFGRGLPADQTRRARQFLMALLPQVGVEKVDLDPGVER